MNAWRWLVASVALAGLAPAAWAGGGVTVTLDPQQPASATFGFHKYPQGAAVAGPNINLRMSYLLYLPHSYADSAAPQPLFVFLHGNGHQGSNLDGILNEGPANFLQNNARLMEQFPMIGLYPQCPNHTRWDTPGMAQAVVALVEEISKTYRVDRDRVYLTGLSMGGEGTWLVAEADPARFAAITPISAIAVQPAKAVRLFKHLHVWIICGANDATQFTAGSKDMDAAMENAGDPVKLTVVPNGDHQCWGRFYPDPRFYLELLQYRRSASSSAR